MRIKKNTLALLTTVFILALIPSGCSAQNSGNTAILQVGSTIISINGTESELDTAPIIQNDRTLLPLRAVVEGLGGSVTWEEETQTAIFAKGEKVIFMTIGSKTAFVNTTEYTLDTEPVIIDGRTMLPIRFVAENLGFQVEWDENTRTITVNEEFEDIELEAENNNSETKEKEMIIKINGQKIPVTWEDNESVTELKNQAEQSPVTVQMSMYGGFEQVGSLGRSYPSNDKRITTQNGDIVLYSSNQIVMFYGSNTWSYTRLGKINLPGDEVTELLGKENVELTISVE